MDDCALLVSDASDKLANVSGLLAKEIVAENTQSTLVKVDPKTSIWVPNAVLPSIKTKSSAVIFCKTTKNDQKMFFKVCIGKIGAISFGLVTMGSFFR